MIKTTGAGTENDNRGRDERKTRKPNETPNTMKKGEKSKKNRKKNKNGKNLSRKGEKGNDELENFKVSGKTSYVLLTLRGETAKAPLAHKHFESAVADALLSLYGIVGGGILRYNWVSPRSIVTGVDHDSDNANAMTDSADDAVPGEAVMRVSHAHYRRIWAALTLLPVIEDNTLVRISVIRAVDAIDNNPAVPDNASASRMKN